MRIMLDTNVLISALIFDGRIGRLLKFLLDSRYPVLVSEYVDREFHDKLEEKWPGVASEIYALYRSMSFTFCESCEVTANRIKLRDPKDIPILNDAIYYNVNIILTGDKDFLESGIRSPMIYSPSMMADFLHIC